MIAISRVFAFLVNGANPFCLMGRSMGSLMNLMLLNLEVQFLSEVFKFLHKTRSTLAPLQFYVDPFIISLNS